MESSDLLLLLDLVGIAVFAASGAWTGVRKELDVFGVVFVAGATALGGGLLRDALIGATPAAALDDWRYLVVPSVVGVAVFIVHPAVNRLARPLLLLDAAGLGLFAVAGARKALDVGLGAAGAIGIGMLTAVGGGLLRDVLVREIPIVLHREVYATAAIVGATVATVGDGLGYANSVVAVVAILATFLVRVVTRWRKWEVPTARPVE